MEEKIYCPYCGAQNDKGSRFCGSCAASLEETKTQEAYQHQTVATQPITQQPAQVVHVHARQPKTQQTTVLGMLGMIIGIISLFVLSWVSLFSYLWMPFMYLGITILGIILSAMSIRQNAAIGVTGLVTGILGGLSQVGWCIFVIFAWYVLI